MDPSLVTEIAAWTSTEIRAFFEAFLRSGSNWVAIAAAVHTKSVEQIQRFYQLMSMLALVRLGPLDFLIDVTTGEGAYHILRIMWELIDVEKMETFSEPFMSALRARLRAWSSSRSFPTVPARTIKLKLCPRSDEMKARMEKAKFTPYLQLRLSSIKSLGEVAQYIASKWQSSSFTGQFRIFPPTLPHVGWDFSTQQSVQAALNHLGAPSVPKFTLLYDCVPLSSIPKPSPPPTPSPAPAPSPAPVPSPPASSPSSSLLPPPAKRRVTPTPITTPLTVQAQSPPPLSSSSQLMKEEKKPKKERKPREDGEKKQTKKKRKKTTKSEAEVAQEKLFRGSSEMAYTDHRGNLVATFSFPRAFTQAASPATNSSSTPSPHSAPDAFGDYEGAGEHHGEGEEEKEHEQVQTDPHHDHHEQHHEEDKAQSLPFAFPPSESRELDPALALGELSLPGGLNLFDGSLSSFANLAFPPSPLKIRPSSSAASQQGFPFPSFSQLSLTPFEPKENENPSSAFPAPSFPALHDHDSLGGLFGINSNFGASLAAETSQKRTYSEAFEHDGDFNQFVESSGFVPFSSLKRSRNDLS